MTIKVRYSDFSTITRSHTDEPSSAEGPIVRRAVALLEKTEAASRPVRLLGVSVHNFSNTTERTRASNVALLPFDVER